MGCCCGKSSDPERTPFAHAPASSSNPTVAAEEPKSARIPGTAHRPPTDAPEVRRIVVRATRIDELDKSFQDVSHLYNDMVEQLELLCRLSYDMTANFCDSSPTTGQPASKDMILNMLQAVKQNAGESLKVSRKHKYCIELQVDEMRVSTEVSRSVRLYNTINNSIRSCMDKLPPLQTSMKALAEDETKFQRNIFVASLGADGPDAASNCRHNFQELEHAVDMSHKINKKLVLLFNNCSEAANSLF